MECLSRSHVVIPSDILHPRVRLKIRRILLGGHFSSWNRHPVPNATYVTVKANVGRTQVPIPSKRVNNRVTEIVSRPRRRCLSKWSSLLVYVIGMGWMNAWFVHAAWHPWWAQTGTVLWPILHKPASGRATWKQIGPRKLVG